MVVKMKFALANACVMDGTYMFDLELELDISRGRMRVAHYTD